jgi:hypothetical protein
MEIAMETWNSVDCIKGEYSTNEILYDATNLTVKLDSFKDNSTVTLFFPNVLAYRVSLEHFRWLEYKDTGNCHDLLYIVENSNYIKWIQDSGMRQLYGDTPSIKHYLLYTNAEIIDVLLNDSEKIILNGKTINLG